MSNILDLSRCAGDHLSYYTDPQNHRAFAAYDRVGNPALIEAVDFLAPAMLQAPVRGQHIIEMHRPDGPYRLLKEALEAVIADEDAATARFEEQDLNANTGPWGLVRAALRASEATPGIKASIVTKILHRKRPHLVPIFDSKVAQFYGTTPAKPRQLWPALQRDVQDHGPWLNQLAKGILTPDGRPLSPLRTLDIVIWEHMTSRETRTAATAGSRLIRPSAASPSRIQTPDR